MDSSSPAVSVSNRLSRSANSVVVHAIFLVVVTRLALFGINWFSMKAMPPSWTEDSQLVGGWSRWDGGHYIRLAMNGYAGENDPGSPAFFPLYPMLMRGLTWVLGMEPTRVALGLAGVMISGLCLLVAVPILARYVEARFGADAARLVTVLLLVSPFSLFFSAVYTEALFLFLVVLVFVLAGKKRWVIGALVVGLATAARVSGLALVPVLVLLAWRGKASWREMIAILVISPLGIGAYMAHTWRVLGDPFAFLSAQDQWGGWHERWGQFLEVYLRRPQDVLTGDPKYAIALINLAVFLICVACLPMMWRRLDPSLALFTSLIVLQGMTSLISLGRYLLPALGLYVVLAILLERPGWPTLFRQGTVIVSAVLLSMLTILFAQDYWVI